MRPETTTHPPIAGVANVDRAMDALERAAVASEKGTPAGGVELVTVDDVAGAMRAHPADVRAKKKHAQKKYEAKRGGTPDKARKPRHQKH